MLESFKHSDPLDCDSDPNGSQLARARASGIQAASLRSLETPQTERPCPFPVVISLPPARPPPPVSHSAVRCSARCLAAPTRLEWRRRPERLPGPLSLPPTTAFEA